MHHLLRILALIFIALLAVNFSSGTFAQPPASVKSIDGTSENHTSDGTADTNADPRPVAVGEVITYRLVTEMPESTSPDVQITDTLSPNVEYIAGSARASYSANNAMSVPTVPGIVNEINPTTPIPAGLITFGVTGPRELRFDLGAVVNNDADNAASAEQLIVEYQVVVVNTSDNTAGASWANDFEVDLNNDGTDEDVSNEVFSIVHEPHIEVIKSINTTLSDPPGTTTFDGGDTVVYDLVVTAGSGANETTGFDLNLLDGIDANLDLIDVDFIGTPGYATTTDNSDYAMPSQTVDVVVSELRPGDSVTVRVTAVIRSSVTQGQVVGNEANVTWTSLPGSQGTGNATPGNSGDSDGERNGNATGENDYADSSQASFTVGGTVNTIKSIDGTSEGHTSDATADTNADPRPVAVGEVITYRLVTEMPESTSPDVQITDTLSPNIEYIAGSARVSYSANNAMNVPTVPGIVNEINPTTPIPAGLITFGVTGPRELRFDLGAVVNNDADNAASAEQLIVEYQVVVVNTSDNTAGAGWANDFEVDLNNDGTDEDVSNQVFSIVHEPVITATKTVVGATLVNPLDAVTFDISITAGNAANQSTGFDLRLLDPLNADLFLESVTIQTNPGYVSIDADNTTYGAAGPVDIILNRLEPGDTVVIRIVAFVLTFASPGEIIDNSATVTWTSLPGSQGTGNTTPGNSGDSNGERNGNTTGENDYTTATNTVSVSLEEVTPVKLIDGTSETATSDVEDGSSGNERPVAIGEVVTYRLQATLPESTTISFRLDDVLANGVEFVSGSARVSYLADTLPSFNGDFGGIQNEAEPTFAFPASRVSFDAGTRTLSFDFGSVINNDGDPGFERIIVEFDAVVIDDAVNNGNPLWANDFDVVIDEGLPTQGITTSNEVAIEVVEPAVTITKTFTPDQQVRGGTTTMILVVSNLSTSDANAAVFDLQVTDTLDDWLDVTNVDVSFNAAATSFGSGFTDNSVLTPGFAAGVTDLVDVSISGLPVDGVATITVVVQIDPNTDPLLLSRTITNSADVTGDSLERDATPDDEERSYTNDAEDDLNVVKPTLLVTKTDSVDPVAAGALMSYTISIQNTGTPNVAATNITFRDQIPPGFVVTLTQPSQGTCSPIVGGVLTCNLGTIASGASASVVITGRYPATTASGTIANNIAHVSSTEGNHGNDGNDTPTDNDDERAEEPTTILRQVDVAVTKTVNDTTPNEGDLIAFTIGVRNNGPSQATNVIVSDSLPAGLTFVQFVPSTLPCVYAAPTITCMFPTLNAGAAVSIGIEATVDGGTSGMGVITNTVSVTTTEPETNLSNNSASATLVVDGVDLLVSKTVSDATPDEGDTVIWNVTVANTGSATSNDVRINDLLPAGVTYVSDNSASLLNSIGGATTYISGTGVWLVDVLNGGAALTLQITTSVDSGTGGTTIANSAALDTSALDQPDSNPNNNQASATIAISGLDMAVTKDVDTTTANEGDQLVYSITAQNLGPIEATDIAIFDDLNALPLTYVSDNSASILDSLGAATSYNSATGEWTIGTLGPGESRTLQIVVTIDSGTNGTTITNVAVLDTQNRLDQSDYNASNNSDDALVVVGGDGVDIAVTKDVDNAAPSQGENVTYNVTVANNGGSAATGVVISEDLPLDGVSLTYVSHIASGGTFTPGTPGTWVIGDLASGQTETLQLTVTVEANAGQITNVALVSNVNETDSIPNNNSDSATITLNGIDLTVTKTVDNPTPNMGDTVTYSIVASNNGVATATGVSVLDILPAGVSYVSDNAAILVDDAGTMTAFTPATGNWAIGQLNGGSNLTLTIQVSVLVSGGQVVNRAEIRGNEPDSDTANNIDDATITVNSADLSLTKSINNTTPQIGDSIIYTVTVSNAGPNSATNVVVTDTLPSTVSYTGTHSASQGTFNGGVWAVGTIPTNGAATLQITVQVVSNAGTFVNVAEVTASDQSDPDSTPNNGNPAEDDYDESSFLFDPPFGRKTLNAAGLPELEWTVVWVNPNNDPLSVTVRDPLPAGTTFVVGSLTCTSPGMLVVTNCAFDVGGNAVVFSGTVFPDPGATPATIDNAANRLIITYRLAVGNTVNIVNNVATLQSVNGDNVAVQETWQRDVVPAAPVPGGDGQPPVVTISKTAVPGVALQGGPLTWTIAVSNPSGIDALGMVVTDNIPAGLVIESMQAAAGTVSVNGQAVRWDIGTLSGGQALSLNIVTRVDRSFDAAITNTVTVAGSNFDPAQASATVQPVQTLPETGETPAGGAALRLLGFALFALVPLAVWRLARWWLSRA